MRVEWAEPWMLLLAALGFFVWRWQVGSPSPLVGWRRRVSAGLRLAILVCLVVALAEPRWFARTTLGHVTWLVDVSRSVGEGGRDAARKLAEAAGAGPAGTSQSWVSFAGRAVASPDEEAALEVATAEVDGDATDLAGAVQLAVATFPPDRTRTVVLVSDGVETAGDLAAQAAALRAAGVRVFSVPVRDRDQPEVVVRGVEAPSEVAEGEPFYVRGTIHSNRETAAEVDVFRDGVRVGTREVRLRRGVNTFETTQTVRGERTTEVAMVVRAEGDTLADNNQGAAQVRSSGSAKALILADDPDRARHLARALKSEGILLDVRPVTGVPTDLGELQNYDLVAIDNLPATDLSMRQMEILAAYVRDFGGGLLMLGGENSFGLGGYHRTPIEEVLPVRCDFQKEKETPSLGMVLVIDRSGSMGGDKIEMAKSAARAAVTLLSPRDYAGVAAFDNEAFWVADFQSAAGMAAIEQQISTLEAGGGTNMAPGMELALDALRLSSAKLKHVILLTDGISTPGPFEELAAQMVAERITLSTVAVGSGADAELLESLARRGNGRYYATDAPENIPQIFTRETMTASKSAIQDLPFLPVVARPAEFLSGIDFDSAPFLLGYVTTRAKPTAEQWLVTESGEPLLTTWRYGLGRVGAFASDARNRWGVEWLSWPQYGTFWAQTFRHLMRPGDLSGLPVTMTEEDGGWRLSVDAVDAVGRFLDGADAEAAVVGPTGDVRKVALERTAPGKLTGWWPATERGGYHAQITLEDANGPRGSQYVSGTIGYPRELLLEPPNVGLLGDVAAATGGKPDPDAADLFSKHPFALAAEKELWPWCVGMALLLFVFDVAVRRLHSLGRNPSPTPEIL